MPTDLEAQISDALRSRADAVQLQQPARRPANPPRRSLLLVAATVLVVLAIALPVAIWRGSSGGGSGTPAAGGGVYVGYRWDVVQIEDRQGSISLDPAVKASVEFQNGGFILGDDTVNALSAAMTPTTSGYVVHFTGTTLAGYAGTDPERLRVINAVDALFYIVADNADDTPPDVRVTATVAGDTLTLHTGSVTVTLDRGGPAPSATPASASSTATHS